MPQYLGIDYLQHALEKTCAFLSFALLPVPDHLDKVENYPHKGLPSEHDIRQFQKKGIDLKELYHEKDISLDDSFKLLCDKMSVIPLDAFTSESPECEEFEEVIFSSFNTPDSGELIYIQPSPSENMLQSEDIEIFCKGDFQEIRKEIDRDQWYLEDVYCSSLFKECIQKLPTLKTYVQRLSLMKIADPLLCADGTLLSENKFFQMNSSIEAESFTETKELFLPITDLHLDIKKSHYFEEAMTPTRHFYFTKTQLNIQQLKDLLQLQEFNVKLNEKDINTILAEHCVKDLSSEFQEKLSQSVINENDAYSFIEKEPTSEMNRLETPLTSPVKEDLPNPNLFHLLEVVPFNINNDMNHVLSPKSVTKINTTFWQKEKFCDEVSTLRLPEPFIEASPIDQNHVKTVLKEIKYSPENISSEVELALTWDPFQDSTIIRKHLEIFYTENLIPIYQNFDHVFVKNREIIEVPCHDQTLDQVELHKSIQWSSNSNHKEKDQLISQKVISSSNDVNLGLNPLDDFFLMRFGNKNSKITTEKETTKRNEEKTRKTELVLHNDYKFIENVLHVTINDEFNVLLQEISNSAEPFIKLLRTSGDLTPGKSFQDLQPDITGFLLNQKQKSLQDAGKKDCINEELEAMIAVHISVSTADVLLNCCFESAIIHLSEMIENDSSIQGCFENLRNTFFKARNNFLQRNITHPKIVSIAKEIEKWQLQNKIKSNFNGKILIITQRNLPGLMTAILDHILLGTKTKAEIVDSNCSKNIQEKLSSLNSSVILMKESLITEDFPWSLFSFVIQYEHNKKASDYLQLCEAKGITFCSMKLIINTNATQNTSICKSNSMRIYNEVIKLIGSEAITHNKQLLQLLETRYNIVIIGRMFHQLSASKRLYFADIIIDERNSIILCSPSQLQEDMLEPFIFRLFSLSIKFSFCYIIITQTTADANSKQITEFSCNLSKLMGTLAILSNRSECSYKILLSYETNETAVFIREISDHCLETSKVWSHQKWLERDWLSEDITKGEKFLINWPCLNSFCAQLMLKSTSLKQLLLLPIEHLKRRFYWLPHQVIELFHQITNKDGGLQLRVTNIPTISFPSQLSPENKEAYPYEPLEFQPLINKKHSSPEDLPLAKEEINRTMPHFKCQKKSAESPNSCLNDNSEFLLEIPDSEFYPAAASSSLSSKEQKLSNRNNRPELKEYSSNDFGFYRKEILSTYKRNLQKKFLLDSNNVDAITSEYNPHLDIHLDYNFGTQNIHYPSSKKIDINCSNELNLASLNDYPQMITDHLSQQKTKLSQEREMFLMNKERKKSTTRGDESETGALNSWSQFFEDFKVENRNKKTMAVSPTSCDLTTPTFQTNSFHIDSTSSYTFPALNYSSSQRNLNPLMTSTPDLLSSTSNEFLSSQKCLSHSTEKRYKKPQETKNFLFSQFSTRNKTRDFHLPQNYTSSHSPSDLSNRTGKTNKIFPDKFAVREVEYPPHLRKRVSIGLAQPLMRDSQETGFMASQSTCSSVINQRSGTELNTSGFSVRNKALKSPESETQFLPSSQFYSGCTSQKKRRLTFEKIPGQKDGQTKLSFL